MFEDPKIAINDSKKDLEALEERHTIGKIDELVYSKYHTKYQNEIKELEEKLGNTSTSVLNLKKCIQNGIKLSRNLSKIYASGDVFEKHKLQQIVFPGKISFNKSKNSIEILRMNSVLELILIINKELNQQKHGSSNSKMPNYTMLLSKVDRSLILDDLLNLEQLVSYTIGK